MSEGTFDVSGNQGPVIYGDGSQVYSLDNSLGALLLGVLAFLLLLALLRSQRRVRQLLEQRTAAKNKAD